MQIIQIKKWIAESFSIFKHYYYK